MMHPNRLQLTLVGLLVALGGGRVCGQGWTETFDEGVGRFTITTGQGESVFVHDPDDGNINGTFIRRNIHQESPFDRRLADLERLFDEGDRVAFSVEFRPLHQNGRFPLPTVGFFDSASEHLIFGMKLAGPDSDRGWWVAVIPEADDPGIPDLRWFVGETYLIEFEIDGPGRLVCASISIRVDDEFVLERSIEWNIPAAEYQFDSLGMGNTPDEAFGSSHVADIDNFSFDPDPPATDVIHVPADFATIQGAIDAACDGDEIIVAPGTYNELINFLGKAITLRSSDGPEVTTIDGTGLDNSVVKCVSGEGPDTLLEGFTITGGTGSQGGLGGGAFISSSPRIADCIFLRNRPGNSGGGLFSTNGEPLIVGCKFVENEVPVGASGGGIATSGGLLILTNCILERNMAGDFGGAIHFGGQSSAAISDCLFSKNVASNGAAIAADGGNQIFVNCTIFGNVAESGNGGGVFDRGSTQFTVTNSILWGNRDGGGEDESAQIHAASVSVNYSDIQGWTGDLGGTGNIGADPLFVDPDNGDLRLSGTSPCIDAASNDAAEDVDTDLDGNPRFVDDPDTEDMGQGDCQIVDMGAYEFQAKGGCCDRIPAWVCDGDVDGDGQVNPVDSGIVQANFGNTNGQALCNYDVDCDGQVNPVDAGIVQSLFGTCEEPRNVCP